MSQKVEKNDDNIKIGISVWVSACLFICIWFLSSFIRGRRQFQNNLHVIEDGLRRMQEEMEIKRRQKSIGYVEDIEEILNKISPGNQDRFQELLKEMEMGGGSRRNSEQKQDENAELVEQDKEGTGEECVASTSQEDPSDKKND